VQNLPMAALEELRMLSNITVAGRASVQTILLGQGGLASADLTGDDDKAFLLRQAVDKVGDRPAVPAGA